MPYRTCSIRLTDILFFYQVINFTRFFITLYHYEHFNEVRVCAQLTFEIFNALFVLRKYIIMCFFLKIKDINLSIKYDTLFNYIIWIKQKLFSCKWLCWDLFRLQIGIYPIYLINKQRDWSGLNTRFGGSKSGLVCI